MTAAMELGDVQIAVDLAPRIDASGLPIERRARHAIETARAYTAGGVGTVAPVAVRFGVGAWPAIAAAVVAHLLYLLVAEPPVQRTAVQPVQRASNRPSEAPARERARTVAERHAAQHGEFPTVSRLMTLADVSRGTAGEVLKALRSRPAPLHLVAPDEPTRTQP
jgi:hypothetical protein